jgi:hypothetical protein
MKMVRSLLLGTAAGFVAIAGAQAADLPVKAKPVQYVKICDLYGAGYYYVPGTDTCIKIGGYVRFNTYYNANGAFQYMGAAPYGGGATQNFYNRTNTTSHSFRTRFIWSTDVRTQTSWGTLRSYTQAGWENRTPTDVDGTGRINFYRAFIQFAGFTVGRAVSAFDVPEANGPVTNNIAGPISAGQSAPTGIETITYTAQFGNGVSASIGMDSPGTRRRAILNTSAGALGFATNVAATSSQQGAGGVATWPDFVANINLTQAWGQAQVSAGIHNIDANYNIAAANNAGAAGPRGWGYAVAAGVLVTNIPGMPGDAFGVSAGWARGATGFVGGMNNMMVVKNSTVTLGLVTDAVWDSATGTGLQRTTAFEVQAGYKHAWSPQFSSSIYGGWQRYDYNATATALICGAFPTAGLVAGPAGVTCNPDFSFWQIGTRLFNWTPVPNLDIGLDVVYYRLNTNWGGQTASGFGGQAAAVRNIRGTSVWSTVFEVRRNFWP